MKPNVIRAIFRRNFVSYFSNPTGYVFICVFVLLSGFAAFWPNEFFNANLANLDQLNRYLPFIMLVFIPAITMSIWADERRQGTDELLLTIPASDFDVVVGKYLAAVAIFTVSLLFSLTNVAVLSVLGAPDLGLLLGTYAGYWLVGLAMLAIGMAASFLTSNLTVGFILGAAFNAPLVFAYSSDVILPADWAMAVRPWSLAEQFRDFGRGVISLSSIVYFGAIIAAMLYLSMVLIGRRHWAAGRDGNSMGGHYLLRVLAIVAAAVGVTTLVARHDARLDVTTERLSSLAPQTLKILSGLSADRPVVIEAFVSPEVPESYVRTRLNLLSMLRELEARGGSKVRVTINTTERFSDNAKRAEDLYGIKGQQVASRNRGAMSIDEIYLGVACSSGLDRVVIPFFDRGVPVEYELVRSIATVSGEKRKRIGILVTDAKLNAEFDMQTFSPGRNELIIDELEKQYEVVQVNAESPITDRYDVLLAVQPSSLPEEQLANFLAAIKAGQPTAIFEDPFPYLDMNVPATSQPRRPRGGMNPMMGGQPPVPKGNIGELWNLLGVDFSDNRVIWQNYNPYPKVSQFPPEFVFVDQGASSDAVFNQADPASAKLQQLLFLFPGAVRNRNSSELEFTTLVHTGSETGRVNYAEMLEPSMFGPGQLNPARRQIPTREEYVLAARIRGKVPTGDAAAKMQMPAVMPMSDEGSPDKPAAEAEPDQPEGETPAAAETKSETKPEAAAAEAEGEAGAKGPKPGEIDVVLVSDIDLLYSAFFAIRNRGDDPDAEVNLDLDNVTFVLNTLDSLSGDDRLIPIRTRRPQHRSLTSVEAWTEEARDFAAEERDKFIKQFDEEREKAQSELDKKIAELQKRTDIDPLRMRQELELVRRTEEDNLRRQTEILKRERDEKIRANEAELTRQIRQVQNRCKMGAVILPPLLPLLIGVTVLFRRRNQEREGIPRSRLR